MSRGLVGWLMMLVMLMSCEHKDLCFDHDPHADRVEFQLDMDFECEWEYQMDDYIDWKENWKEDYGVTYEDLRPKPATGVRAQIYDESGKRSMYNLNDEYSSVRFEKEGLYSFLFYNNDTEYILFNELESFSTVTATTRTVSRKTYQGSPYRGAEMQEELTVNPPDMLFGAYRDSVWVEKMSRPDTLNLTLHPLVFTYLVQYHVAEGLEYVSLARGALAGMARGVRLSDARTLKEDATVLFDCEMKDFGAQASVKSFGIPDYPNDNYSRGDRSFGLNLEVRLKNGVMMHFDFDVTEQVSRQPHGGVIVVEGIEIPEDVGDAGGGAFDVNVNGWGEYEDVLLPLI